MIALRATVRSFHGGQARRRVRVRPPPRRPCCRGGLLLAARATSSTAFKVSYHSSRRSRAAPVRGTVQRGPPLSTPFVPHRRHPPRGTLPRPLSHTHTHTSYRQPGTRARARAHTHTLTRTRSGKDARAHKRYRSLQPSRSDPPSTSAVSSFAAPPHLQHRFLARTFLSFCVSPFNPLSLSPATTRQRYPVHPLACRRSSSLPRNNAIRSLVTPGRGPPPCSSPSRRHPDESSLRLLPTRAVYFRTVLSCWRHLCVFVYRGSDSSRCRLVAISRADADATASPRVGSSRSGLRGN